MKFTSLRSLFSLVLTLFALCGCALPNAKDGAALTPKQGLLAFHVSSNADGAVSYVDYADTSTFVGRLGEEFMGPKGLFRITAGESFYLVPVDAGEYMFSKLTVAPRFAWLQATNRFKVKANTITYIGHIRLNVTDSRFGLQVRDQELDMRAYLAGKYPVYFQAMDFEKSFAELSLQPN